MFTIRSPLPLVCAIVLTLASAAALGSGTTFDVVVHAQPRDDASVTPRRPTRAEVLRYRGLLANIRDGEGRIIWTPALPGASPAVRRDWLRRLAAAGATHVPLGPFEPGPAYPGVAWANPDWTDDAAAIRALLLEILSVPSAAGHGLVPVIFLDGGGAHPLPRLRRMMPTVSRALQGIGAFTATVPCGWEPYEWRPSECAQALREWKPLSQGAVIAWHGPQTRLSGASRPAAEGDPWRGREAAFYREHGGQFIDTLYFQTLLVRTMAEAQCAPVGATAREGQGDARACWKDAAEQAIARVGASVCPDGETPCDWRTMPVVIFEATAHHEFRGQAEAGVSTVVADAAQALCRKYAVSCGFGNGLPTDLTPPDATASRF